MKGEKGEREGGTGCAIEGQEEEEERERVKEETIGSYVSTYTCVFIKVMK